MQSLSEYSQSHRQVWNDNYIVDNYRRIIRVTLADLWHHPLLMTCNERYYFPHEALIEVMCVENWETDYANYTENHIPSYGKRNIETTIQNSKYAIAFESVYQETYQREDGYQNNAVVELTYSKNIVDRIGKNLAKTNQKSLTMHEVEQELTSLFPERLTELYSFFVVKKKISMSFLQSSRV
ncbi:unnamed protein product [Prunus armeniaca]|uniref:Uncharacterized protein n=1 Tax=Prunus armeniaca TaxID=36596 RepID=A0A6J5WT03_PRUAR|nr:unnamed protein product [Prunus armeniaca]CAB4304098.1 unnamed protein product [Prunus armeniaca]